MGDATERHEELVEFQRKRDLPNLPITWFTKTGTASKLKTQRMNDWMSQSWPDATSSVGRLFGIDGDFSEASTTSTISSPTKAVSEANTKEIKVAPSKTEESGTIPEVVQQPCEPPFQDFLLELTKTMQLFFSQQTEILKTGADLQLGAIQEVLQQLQQSAVHQVIHQPTPLPNGFVDQPGAFEPRSRFASDLLAVPPKATSMPFCCQLAPAHPKPRRKAGERHES